MIKRVGHVRVSPALASAISAVMILYRFVRLGLVLGRVLIGFCFSACDRGFFANAADNSTGGQALSLYDRADAGHRDGCCCWWPSLMASSSSSFRPYS
jgi:hypothetical protein